MNTPKPFSRRSFLAAAGLAPAAIRALHGQSAGLEPGFVSLFDGRTLDGWSIQEGPASAFTVQDGAIVVDKSANFPTWLRSDKQYENFEAFGTSTPAASSCRRTIRADGSSTRR
jgi:hypothetical protein